MSKILHQLAFLSSAKYFINVVTFIRGLLIAKVFSQKEYADWGVVMYVSAYYSIVGLGIPNLILLAVEKYSYGSKEMTKVVSTALLYIFILALIMILIALLFPDILQGVSRSISLVGLIIMSFGLVITEALRNLARIAENYRKIVISDFASLIPLLLLLLLFPDIVTPNFALSAMIFGIYLSIIFLWNNSSFNIDFKDIAAFGKEIILRGFPILFYNYSSYLLFIIFRADVLASNNDEIISNFNFAWLIVNSIVIFLGIINWYYYPILLRKIRPNNRSFKKVLYHEVILIQLIISIPILFIAPRLFDLVISIFMNKYHGSIIHFRYLLSVQILLYLTYYSSTYLIVIRNKYILYFAGLTAAGLLFTCLTFIEDITAFDLNKKYIFLHLSSIIFVIILHLKSPLQKEKITITGLLLAVIIMSYLSTLAQFFVFLFVLYQAYLKRSIILDLFYKLNETNHNI